MIAAISRGDVAGFVSALFLVYFVLILLNIVLSWVQQVRPIPYNVALRSVVRFITDSTDPYLNLFRRFIPPIGMLDVSPILAILVLVLVQGIVVGAING